MAERLDDGSAGAVPDDLRAELSWLASLRLPEEYHHDQPFPSDIDARIRALVERFAAADELRTALKRAVTIEHVGPLSVFAVRMAMLAVRERSLDRLRLGLRAAALSGSADLDDPRDAASALLPLVDAADRVGADAPSEFADAARSALPGTARLLEQMPPRHTWSRLLERAAASLGIGDWRATEAPDGFRYVFTRPVTKAQVDEMIRRVEQARRSSTTREDR